MQKSFPICVLFRLMVKLSRLYFTEHHQHHRFIHILFAVPVCVLNKLYTVFLVYENIIGKTKNIAPTQAPLAKINKMILMR